MWKLGAAGAVALLAHSAVAVELVIGNEGMSITLYTIHIWVY